MLYQLRTFRSLSPDSLERRDFIRASKPFFAEVSELIKNAQMAANIPMLEKQVSKMKCLILRLKDKHD